jgi:hypothetical protein
MLRFCLHGCSSLENSDVSTTSAAVPPSPSCFPVFTASSEASSLAQMLLMTTLDSDKLFGLVYYYYFLWLCSPARAMASFTRFLDHTQRCTTVGRTPLDE